VLEHLKEFKVRKHVTEKQTKQSIKWKYIETPSKTIWLKLP